MSTLVTSNGIYKLYQYDTEKEFEESIIRQSGIIFGIRSVYIDCKRRIGKRGTKRSIPDGYLIDFSSESAPRLFVVETELAAHDLFQHNGRRGLLMKFFNGGAYGSQT